MERKHLTKGNRDKGDGFGDEFQTKSKYVPEKMSGSGLDWNSKPKTYKEYPEKIIIELKKPDELSALNVKENFTDVLKTRKSIRFYRDVALSLDELSYLLWASTGIQRLEQGYAYRTAPSAGALYPIETYLVVNNVDLLKRGVYHYNIRNHYLELLREGDFRVEIATAALGQKMCADASVVFVFSAIFQRSKWKYKQRAYRYVYLDAGHIGENLALATTALGLGGCQIGAIFDDLVNRIIQIDGIYESAIYLTSIGKI